MVGAGKAGVANREEIATWIDEAAGNIGPWLYGMWFRGAAGVAAKPSVLGAARGGGELCLSRGTI